MEDGEQEMGKRERIMSFEMTTAEPFKHMAGYHCQGYNSAFQKITGSPAWQKTKRSFAHRFRPFDKSC
jgi:hypothetical protein